MARVVLYSAPGCAGCRRAKASLEAEGVAFTTVCVTALEPDQLQALDRLSRGAGEVPQLFCDGELVGGLRVLEVRPPPRPAPPRPARPAPRGG